jgi:hypothetical protein
MMSKPRFGLLALALAAPAASAMGGTIEWTATPASPVGGEAAVQLMLTSRDGGGRSVVSRPATLRSLEGLDAATLSSGGPVAFRIAREAGRLDCSGTAARKRGEGRCGFTPDAAFAAELARRGVGRPSASQQYQLALHDVRLALVAELDRQGYARPSVGDLTGAAIHGVTPGYLRELDALGLRVGSVGKLTQLRIHGVDPAFVRELAAIRPAYRKLGADDLVKLRIHGVRAETVRGFAEAGYRDLSVDQLTRLAIHGVTPAYARDMAAAGYTRLTADQLVRMRIHGVTADLARKANAARN